METPAGVMGLLSGINPNAIGVGRDWFDDRSKHRESEELKSNEDPHQ